VVRLLKRCVIVGFLCVCALSLTPLTASAGSSLASSFSGNQTSSIVRDQTNHLQRVWVEESGDGGSRLLYQALPLSGSPDTPATLIHASANRIRRPHIAVDANQTVHLLWQERFAKGAGARNSEGTWVHYTRLVRGPHGVVVSRNELLNERPMAMHPYLAVDAHGVAYSVWEEGQDSIILARIPGHNAIERRRIATHFGKDVHGYPAVAIDRHGNLHVTWTGATDAQTTQIAYEMFQAPGAGAHRSLSALIESPKQALYRSAQPFNQPKTIGVDPATGRVVIAWRNQRERGPIGRLAAQTISMTVSPAGLLGPVHGNIRHGNIRHEKVRWKSAKTLSVLDANLTSQPSLVELALPVAAVGKPLVITAIRTAGGAASPPTTTSSTLHRFDDTVGKLHLLQLLKFSSWSGPPPAPGGSVAQAEFVSIVPPLLSVRFLPFNPLNPLQEASLRSTRGAQPLRLFLQKEVAIQV
jgi:hypothetical protein